MINRNHIVAVSGLRGSGKSTVAKFLEEKYAYIRTSFAYPLKQMLIKFVMIQGCTYDDAIRLFYGDLKNTPCEYFDGKTPTHAMIMLGTEWGRDLISPNLWVNAWKRNVNNIISKRPNTNIVVDDLRFLTESVAVRLYPNTTIVRIERDGCEQLQHQSETEHEKIPIDLVIYNNSSLDILYDSINIAIVDESVVNTIKM